MEKMKNFGKTPKYGIGDKIEIQEVKGYKSYCGIFLDDRYAKFLSKNILEIEKIEISNDRVIYYSVNSMWRIPEGIIIREVEE